MALPTRRLKLVLVLLVLLVLLGTGIANVDSALVKSEPFDTSSSVACILSVSVARTGSTALSKSLQHLPNQFSILEPYHAWRALSVSDIQTRSIPSYSDLFSCATFRTRPGSILWAYPCRYANLLGCNTSNVDESSCRRCFHGVCSPLLSC
ncbi:uncharacterized protein MONBRDRAFT_12418 [Monosiga brevicollis MX1]|uniref:Uncharacterized protein n=1 Tax=Monosiga brevicollis TaxID=81824 RepID=A9VC77_MONBE|nr:uncharacterized protein MONBRDRAFT_12418 [Monosiga brevicollis MX1]EDQ84813.1 predicted protein [Monosiga brevicollis MX1]|eukprot:XP_001750314.1 hypothetical protein [Monosiga brevicollis MX1]